MQNAANLYETDFYAWTQEQVKLINNGEIDKLDLVNLQEEIDSMGKHEKRELISRLTVLIMHLLKWKYQPNYENKNSWKYTIKEQRKEIYYHLKDNPSLKNQEYLQASFERAYEFAIYDAIRETGLSEKNFPETCEWNLTQILDDEFYPN